MAFCTNSVWHLPIENVIIQHFMYYPLARPVKYLLARWRFLITIWNFFSTQTLLFFLHDALFEKKTSKIIHCKMSKKFLKKTFFINHFWKEIIHLFLEIRLWKSWLPKSYHPYVLVASVHYEQIWFQKRQIMEKCSLVFFSISFKCLKISLNKIR